MERRVRSASGFPGVCDSGGQGRVVGRRQGVVTVTARDSEWAGVEGRTRMGARPRWEARRQDGLAAQLGA